MNADRSPARRTLMALAAIILGGSAAHGQTSAQKAKHPTVCAQGVRIYTEASQIPTPHDTVTVPPPDAPVRVTSPEELEMAELAMRGRAGSAGATGVLIQDDVSDDGNGNRRLRRNVIGFFVPSDSAHAQQACAKKS